MIQFLTSPWPLLVAGLTIPLAAHLLARLARRRVTFPAIMLLARRLEGTVRPSRLRDAVALLLRCAALALVALAVAGAYLTRQGGGGSQAPALVVVDASASMRQSQGGISAFEEARGTAGQLLHALSPRPAALAVAGSGLLLSGPPDTSRGAALALLARATPGFGSGRVPDAIARAPELLGSTGDVYVVTDLARSSLQGIGKVPEGVSLHVVRVGSSAANSAVQAISMKPGVALQGRTVEVSADVATFGEAPADVKVAITAGDDRHVETLHLPPGSIRTAVAEVTLPREGFVPVVAEIVGAEPDALAEDDKRHGVIEVVRAPGIDVFGDEDPEDARGALRPVLAALQASGARVRQHRGIELGAVTPGGGAILTVGLQVAPETAALAAHLRAGGTWLQIVASDADAALCAPLAGIEPPVVLGPQREAPAREPERLHAVDLEHPLLHAFLGREALLRTLRLRRIRPATPAASAAAPLTLADGTPVLAERLERGGRWVVWNASPAETDTNIAALDLMPLLFDALLDGFAPPLARRLDRDCGTPVRAPAGAEGPGGRRLPPVEGTVRLDEPGVYTLDGGGSVAAGIPPAESDLRPISDATAAGAVAAADVLSGTTVRERSPLWPWLLLGAALASCVELWIAGRASSFRPLARESAAAPVRTS